MNCQRLRRPDLQGDVANEVQITDSALILPERQPHESPAQHRAKREIDRKPQVQGQPGTQPNCAPGPDLSKSKSRRLVALVMGPRDTLPTRVRHQYPGRPPVQEPVLPQAKEKTLRQWARSPVANSQLMAAERAPGTHECSQARRSLAMRHRYRLSGPL